jgi:pentatricopeptide repeat protein
MKLPTITILFMSWFQWLASTNCISGYAFSLSTTSHFCPTMHPAPNKHHIAFPRRLSLLGTRQKECLVDYSAFEVRDRNELQWLVQTTSQLIGSSAKPVGTLHKSMIHETHKAMQAWSRRSTTKPDSNAPHVVEQLLHRLIQEQHAGNPHVIIDTRTYNLVIASWSRSNEEGAAKRAEEILVGMVKQYDAGNESVKPNRASFNSVIKSWVRKGNMAVAVTKAEAWIDYMVAASQRDPHFLPPCRRGYNLLLYAYTRSSNLANAGQRAENILNEMLRGAEDAAIAPDINSFNQVIKTWANGKSKGFEQKAQAIFDLVLKQPNVKPNHETYNAILSSWLKSTDKAALSHILTLLEKMETDYNEGNLDAKPDRVAVNSVMSALSRSGELERVVQLQNRMEEVYDIDPDTVSNNVLISSWSKSHRSEAPERTLEILTQMEDAFRKGNRGVMPDNYSYTSVIDCFSKTNRPLAGSQAIALLGSMKALHRDHGGDAPSTGCYNAVLNSLATARNKDSADLAFSILFEMETQSKELGSSVPKPNRITYNTVLKACRNGHDEYATRAERLLVRMLDMGTKNPSLAPDSYTYAAVVNVLGRSDHVDKAERVLRVLNQMIAFYKDRNSTTKPSTHVFNAALNACAFSRYDMSAKSDAFAITTTILALLQEYAQPDDVTYGTILRACSNLLPKTGDNRRDKVVGHFFRKAQEEGLVSEMVLKQLKFAASPELFRDLLGMDRYDKDEGVVSLNDLPRSWSNKVISSKRKISRFELI